MAMFARRSIQRLLDDLKGSISLEARKKLAFEMDRQRPSALGYEWELALVYALSRVGKVDYEAESPGGTRRPDISFVSADGSLRCVADVTTISDAGLHEQNPVRRFSQALYKLKSKCGLKGSLNHRIEAVVVGPNYRDRKTTLKLPKVSEMDRFLEQHAGPHFRAIAQQKLKVASFKIEASGVECSVTYNEDERYGGMSYPAYTAAQSLKRNPVYKALKLKRDQLKDSGAAGPFGIFLCDGGCTLLSRSGRQQMQFGLDDVVQEFFRQHSSIAFVGVLVFPPSRYQVFDGILKEKRIIGQIYSNPRSSIPLDCEAFLPLINRGLASLPAPIATPLDALHWISRSAPHEGQTTGTLYQWGGGHMTVKISARHVQELLAGKMTATELFAKYARPGERVDNPFERALNRGFTIEAVRITKQPDQDDDLIEIAFGFPDPAIGKFRVD